VNSTSVDPEIPHDVEIALAVPLIEYRSPPPPLRRSISGVVSFCVGIAWLIGYGAAAMSLSGRAVSDAMNYTLIGIFITLPAIGLALGIMSCRRPHRRRGLAVAGVALNGVFLLVILFSVMLTVIDELS
jgi:hypothetical protein